MILLFVGDACVMKSSWVRMWVHVVDLSDVVRHLVVFLPARSHMMRSWQQACGRRVLPLPSCLLHRLCKNLGWHGIGAVHLVIESMGAHM